MVAPTEIEYLDGNENILDVVVFMLRGLATSDY